MILRDFIITHIWLIFNQTIWTNFIIKYYYTFSILIVLSCQEKLASPTQVAGKGWSIL